MRKRRIGLKVYGALAVVFLLGPTLIIVPMSFSAGRTLKFPPDGWSLRWYDNLLSSPRWTDAAWTSLRVAIAVTVISLLLGIPASLALRRRFFGRAAVSMLILAPLVVPLIVIGIAVFVAFADWGLTGSATGLIVAHTVLALPFVVVSVSAGLSRIDVTLEQAASSLGASHLRTFMTVTLPLIAPSVAAGALFAFITSWDEAVVAVFLNSPKLRTLPVVMWTQVRTEIDPTIAAAATLLTLATTVAIVTAFTLAAIRTSRNANS